VQADQVRNIVLVAMGAAEPLLLDVGRKVRARRQQQGHTLKELAKAAGLSERFVGELEAGRANISLLNLAQVAQALKLSMGHFFEASKDEPPRGVIALLGLRGAGKSSIGRALADRLDVGFYELDQLVEAAAGMRLQELFAIHGEDYFRQLELTALTRFLESHPRGVLATGGGLVTSPEAFDLLLARTETVWLKATPEEHWTRVVKQGDLRPMQNRPHAMSELKRRLKEREPLYSKARRQCVTSSRTVNAVVHELAEAL
jgi:XRE family transcriptional regulator, aerobic/anaerobic benzoate catabolism transcriptional regulator